MPSYRVSVSANDLLERVRSHFIGSASPNASQVLWAEQDAELLIRPASLALRLTQGWLLATVGVETAETGASTVYIPFFLGRGGSGSGLHASAGLDGSTNPIIAARWGEALHAAVWNGVLDVLEAAVALARDTTGQPSLTLAGYTAGEGVVQVLLVSPPKGS